MKFLVTKFVHILVSLYTEKVDKILKCPLTGVGDVQDHGYIFNQLSSQSVN